MTTNHRVDDFDPKPIPLHGPAWTLYAYTALALLVAFGLVLGFLRAGALH